MLQNLMMTGGRCDFRTHSGKVVKDAKFSDRMIVALMYGAGAKGIQPILDGLEYDSPDGGGKVPIGDIWMILPMPKGGISESMMMDVDLRLADKDVPGTRKKVREVIAEFYKETDPQKLEPLLRRYLAS